MDELGEMTQVMGITINGFRVFAEIGGHAGLLTLQCFVKLCKLLLNKSSEKKMNKTGEVNLKQLKYKEGDSLVMFELEANEKEKIYNKMKKAGLAWTELPDFDTCNDNVHIMLGSSAVSLFSSIIDLEMKKKVDKEEKLSAKEVNFEEYLNKNGFTDDKGNIKVEEFDAAIKKAYEKEGITEDDIQKKTEVKINGEVINTQKAEEQINEEILRNIPEQHYFGGDRVVAEDENSITLQVKELQLQADKSVVYNNTSGVVICTSPEIYSSEKIVIKNATTKENKACTEELLCQFKELAAGKKTNNVTIRRKKQNHGKQKTI